MPQDNNLPLEMLRRCKPGILPYLRTPDGHPEFQYYGLGDSPNWSTQCTAKAFGAFAELAANGDESSLSIALNLLHYLLETHKSGSFHGVDGLQWGNTWISSLALERVLFAAALRRPVARTICHAWTDAALRMYSRWSSTKLMRARLHARARLRRARSHTRRFRTSRGCMCVCMQQ